MSHFSTHQKPTSVTRKNPAWSSLVFLFFILIAAPWTSASNDSPIADQGVFKADYFEIPGVREFSSRLIARPLQPEALLKTGATRSEAAASVASARREMDRFEIIRHVPETDEYIFYVPEGSTENETTSDLIEKKVFQYVEPDWIVYPVGTPNDPKFSNQWHHQANRMQSADGWDIHTGNSTVAVGICDTGVLTTHQDLQLHRLEGYNAVDRKWESNGGNIGPVASHGTLTTGCAAANGNNGVGVVGVGWNLSHRMLRVSNSSGGGAYLSDLQHAARVSVDNGDKVSSISYSGVDSSSNLTTATYVKNNGGLMVWAAGNDGRNLTLGDRDNDDLIVAGATDQNDNSASFSNYGKFVDLVAPGVDIYTTHSSGNSSYTSSSGTSFSCPLTAGLCALIFSANSSLTPDQVENTLKQSADDLGTSGVDNTFGYGRINVNEAMLISGGGGDPITDIKVNGSDGFLSVSHTQSVPITISLDPGDQAGVAHDWWIFVLKDWSTTFYWSPPTSWIPSGTPIRSYNGGLVAVNSYTVAQGNIPVGWYTFTFAVDALDNTYQGTFIDTCEVQSY